MKILSLSCCNINSLKGEMSRLELGQGLLSEYGLFVITGPTGAGKSTLLDIICVALYGKTPRLGQHTDHLMSKTTGYCWAEVDFEVNEKVFRSRWELHRSRKKVDGAMQGSKMFLSEVDANGQGKLIEEKTSKVPLKIQDLTGLDFQRFCRSMLLAQGEFDAFLKGSNNERAELLEKMTGTEIYRDISVMVFDKAKQAQQNWKNQEQWQVQHLKNKSSRSLSELEHEKQIIETQKLKLKLNLSEREHQLELVQKYHQVQKEKSELDAEVKRWESDNQSEKRKKWLLWKRAEVAEKTYDQLGQINLDIKHRQNEVDVLKQKIEKVSNTQSEVKQGLQQKLALYKEVKTDFEKLDAIYPKIIELLEKERHLIRSYEKLSVQQKQLNEKIETLQTSQVRQADELKAIKTKVEFYQDQFELKGLPDVQRKVFDEVQVIQQEMKNLKNIYQTISDKTDHMNEQYAQDQDELSIVSTEIKTIQQQIDQLENELENQVKKMGDYEKKSESWDIESLNECLVQLNQCEEKLKKKNELIQTLEVLNKEHEIQLKKIEQLNRELKVIKEERLKQHFHEHRLKLEEGEECPLCGSLDHPWGKHEMENQVFNDREFENKEKELNDTTTHSIQLAERIKIMEQDVHELNNHLSAFINELELTSDDLNAVKSRHRELLEQKEILDALTKLEQSRDNLDADLFKSHAQLSEKKQKIESIEWKLKTIKEQLDQDQVYQSDLMAKVKELEESLFEKALFLDIELMDLDEDKIVIARQKITQDEKDYSDFTIKLRDAEKKQIEGELKLSSLDQNQFDLKQELSSAIQNLDQIKSEKERLHPDADQFEAVYRNRQKEMQQCKENVNHAEKQKLELDVKLIQAKETYEKNLDALPKLTLQLDNLEHQLNEQIQKHEFENREQFVESLLSVEEREELSAWNLEHELKGREIEMNVKRLDSEKVEDLGLDVATLTANVNAIKNELELTEQKLGSLQKEIEQENLWQEQHDQQEEAIKKLEKDFLEWDQLKRLIGSADGSAFRKIAQQITLRYLLKSANKHLDVILERYRLREFQDKEMGIVLLDRYQAMSVRPLETLSGGERFMISLALALALSDISRRHQSIESLFIDEGFGALDVHALDRVLEALDKIRQMGRNIGIISHIEALKERIPVQVQVTPTQGGVSRVSLVGG